MRHSETVNKGINSTSKFTTVTEEHDTERYEQLLLAMIKSTSKSTEKRQNNAFGSHILSLTKPHHMTP